MAQKNKTNQKGNYYKLKTKKYLEEKGFHVEYLEQLQRIYTKGRVIFIKRDLLASDGLAMDASHLIFWQSKLGRKNIADAVKQYNSLPFPPFVDRWIIVWEARKSEPEIIDMNDTKENV